MIAGMVFILFAFGHSFAVISDVGLDPMDQTSGARPYGMGGAFVGVSDDLNSLFYNPAGLANVRGLQLTARDIKNYSFGFAYGTQIGTFGLGLVSKNYQDMVNITDEANYEHSLALIAYGVEFGNVSFGISLKQLLTDRFYMTGSPEVTSKTVYEGDVGLLWNPVNYASIGVVMHNVGETKYSIGSSDEVIPKLARAGISINILGNNSVFHNETFGLKIAMDSEGGKVGDKDIQNSYYGLESSYNDWLFIRLGSNSIYKGEKNIDGTSAGIGFKIGETELDFSTLKDPLTDSQVSYFSVVYFPSKPGEFQMAGTKEKPRARETDLLTITFPEDDIETYDEMISIEGKARPEATVLVNGVNVYLESNGEFRVIQPLNIGKNLIEIETSSYGEKKTISKKVLRKAKVVLAEEEGLNRKIVDDVLNKEAEINKKESQIRRDRDKGIDVSERELLLEAEKRAYETRKSELTAEKQKIEQRKAKVENLATLGVVEVAPNKSFAIETPIKRGEMISWLVKSMGLPIQKIDRPVFADVPPDHEYGPYIRAAFEAGYIKKPVDNKFRPDDPVTEEEGQEFFRAFGLIR